MTREEATIKVLRGHIKSVEEIIEALEQEPRVAQERYEDLCEYFGEAKDILNNREDFKAWLGRVKWHIHKAEELSAENDDLRDQLAMRDRFQKQEPKTEQFAKWVATEIFDDNWEYNKDAFAEIACRKLEKLGIVRANGDVWELVEPQESEDCRNCKKWSDCECGRKGHINGTSIGYSIGECKDYEPQESEGKE